MPNRPLRRTVALLLSGMLLLQALPALAAADPAPGRFERDRSQRPVKVKPALVAQQSATRYREGEVLVTFKSGLAAAAVQSASRLGFREKRRLAKGRAAVMTGRPGQTVQQMIAQLKASGLVAHAQPNYIYEVAATPSDPYWGNLWGLENRGQQIKNSFGTPGIDIGATPAWDLLPALDPVIVAIVDTGVDIRHPELAGRLWTNTAEIPDNGIDDDGNNLIDDYHGWDFAHGDNTVYDVEDGDDHGTHVAGTIAAAANAIGIRGVAPNVQIMPLKFLTPNGGSTEHAVAAIDYAAAKGARILNASFGMPDVGDVLLKEAIDKSGMVVVAAAGNAGTNTDDTPFYPASFNSPNLISVAAVNNQGELPDFSNYGQETVDVGAPGDGIYSLYPGGPSEVPAAVFKTAATYKAVTVPFGPERLGQSALNDLIARVRTYLYPTGFGSPTALIVDDSYTPGDEPSAVPAYKAALQQAGFTVGTPHIHRANSDVLTGQQLSQYDLVLWFTGEDSGDSISLQTLTVAERTSLTEFLAGGRKLILAGEDAIFGNESSPFVRDMLGVSFIAETGDFLQVRGADAVGMAGFQAPFLLGNDRYHYNDVVEPRGAGAVTGLYQTEIDWTGAYQYLSGTSMAAPHVSGIAAVLMAQKNLSPLETIDLIKQSGTALPALATTTATGKMVSLKNSVATQVTAPSVALSDQRPGAASVHTFTFTTGAFGRLKPGRGAIRITFPVTDLPAAVPAGLITINGIPAGAATTESGHTLVVGVPAQIEPAMPVTVRISEAAGIRNPAQSASVQYTISTTADPAPQVTPHVQITPTVVALERDAYAGLGAENGERLKALVTVTHPAGNAHSGARETLQSRVTSTSDGTGITLTLTETGPDTGIFTARFGFTNGTTTPELIKVADGDTVWVSTLGAEVAGTAVWHQASSTPLLILGSVDLQGHPLDQLTVTLSDGTALRRGAAAFRSGPLVAGTYSVTATAGTGAAQVTGVRVGHAEPGVQIVTVTEGEAVIDEYRFVLPPLVLSPAAPGYDGTPPALAQSSPAAGATNVLRDAPIRLTFSEPVRFADPAAGPTAVALTDAFGNPQPTTVQIADNVLSLTGHVLADGATYMVTVPAGTLVDHADPPNVLAEPVSLGFTTLPPGVAAPVPGSWPECGQVRSEPCVVGLTVSGAQPHRYRVKVTGPTDGKVQVQLLDMAAAPDRQQEVVEAGEVTVRLYLTPHLTARVTYGTAENIRATFEANQLTITGRPRAVPWNHNFPCGPAGCPPQADVFYQGLFNLTLGALPTAPAALSGMVLLGRGQYVTPPAYSAADKSLRFQVGGPYIKPDGVADSRSAEVILPDAFIRDLWGRDPVTLSDADFDVIAGGERVSITMERLTGGWEIRLLQIPVTAAEISLAPRGIKLNFDRPVYVGVGAENVPWDDTEAYVRRKVLVTMTDDGTYNRSDTQVEQATAMVRNGPDGTAFLVTLTEDGPNSRFFTGSFGFTSATEQDANAALVKVSQGATIHVSVVQSATDATPGASAQLVWVPAAHAEFRVTGQIAHEAQAATTVGLYRVSTGAGRFQQPAASGTGRSAFSFGLPMSAAGTTYKVGAGGFHSAAWSSEVLLSAGTASPIAETDAGGVVRDVYLHDVGTLTLTADTAGPAAPALVQPILTEGGRLYVAGRAEPFAQLMLQLDGADLTTLWVGRDGHVAFQLGGIPTGLRTLEIRGIDIAFNLGEPVRLIIPVR